MTVKDFACAQPYTMIAADGATHDYIVSHTSEHFHRYKIGDIGPSGVGTVFYVSEDGSHGLELAKTDWYGSRDYPVSVWSNCLARVRSSLCEIGSGLSNTQAIVSQAEHIASAAHLCQSYTGGMKTDWYLPSLEELKEARRTQILDGRKYDVYWSSTEYPHDPDFANYLMLESGTAGFSVDLAFKLTEIFVRPIRSF